LSARHAAPTRLRYPDLTARRTLYRYPRTAQRFGYLSIAVGSTIVLYYELYIFGGVTPLVLAHYQMSFTYYVNILVVANLTGAFGSLAAGLGDRIGRINIVVYGLAITGLLTLLTPLASIKPLPLITPVLPTPIKVLFEPTSIDSAPALSYEIWKVGRWRSLQCASLGFINTRRSGFHGELHDE
jgi:MFS family permease